MQFAYDIISVVGKLSFMLIVLGAAVLVSQAFWFAFIMKGAQLVKQRQVLSMRDVIIALGEDGVWLAYLLKNPVACFAAALAGALTFRAGVTHPGWIGLAVIGAFFAFGPVLKRARKAAAALLAASVIALPKKS